ncbi:MAG: transcription antitermination factor NusB, partial [Longimicrobiales bacterium]
MTFDDAPPQVKLDRSERIDRSRARAWALQIHYRWESSGFEGTLRDALVDTTATRRIAQRRLPYIRALLTLLDEHIDEIDRTLRRYLDNWSLDRLSRIDRAVLRLGAVELLYRDDIPPKVAIQEAIH